MDPDNQTVFNAALALPEAERIVLVQRLLETLSPEANVLEEELAEELERRLEEAQEGRADPIPWSELEKQS